MPYQKKYYFSFKDIRLVERTHLVELWQNTDDMLTAEEVKASTPPFIVEMPELDHKFQVVRGTGCTINLLSDTDMKFYAGLYHVDPTEFLVKHYIDGTLNWIGYLNSEMITEPYDINFNYPVSVTGNDGFSLMDRFAFLQTDGTQYTGVKSKFELLQIVFGKIGLPWSEYRISLSTTFTGYSGAANSTILHESYINCANFYDEDKKPMTLRDVVDAILAPYGAYIRSEGTIIYITDIHNLASNSSVTYKRFTYSTGGYVADVVVSNQKAIADIGYIGTGQSIELSGGKNRQVVAYSPYPFNVFIGDSLTGQDEFGTVPASWGTKNDFYFKTLQDNDSWEIDPTYDFAIDPPTFEASFYQDESDVNVYLRHKTYAGVGQNQRIAYTTDDQYVNISGITLIDPTLPQPGFSRKYFKGTSILITGDVLIKTKLNPYRTGVELSYLVIKAILTLKVKIGSYYYDSDLGKWTTNSNSFCKVEVSESQSGVIADKFVPLGKFGNGVLIPIGNFDEDIILDGEISVEIWSRHVTYTKISSHENFASVMEIWYSNLSISVSNLDGSLIDDNDVDYIGLLDKKYQNEAEKIELKCGTDSRFSDRAKIMGFDGTNYFPIKEWTRASQTFKIEELLLNSLSSNYRMGFVKLYGMNLRAGFDLQNVLTDTFIGTKKLMVNSAIIDYRDDKNECSLIEITPDELTIVKDATIY